MPRTVNPYFELFYNQDEQSLVRDLVTESIQIHGLEILYVPRKLVNLDRFYGEDPSSIFEKSYPIEAYVNSFNQFDGDKEFMSKFGAEIRNEISFNVAIDRFDELVQKPHMASTGEFILRPREGDLIYFPIDKKVFEISECEKRSVFFQLGNLYMHLIKCKEFELAGEEFKTGVDDIDLIEDHHDFAVTFTVNSGYGEYIPGEPVVCGDWQAKVSLWNENTSELKVIRTAGEGIPTSGLISGSMSGATYSISSAPELGTNEPTENNDQVADPGQYAVIQTSNPLLGT